MADTQSYWDLCSGIVGLEIRRFVSSWPCEKPGARTTGQVLPVFKKFNWTLSQLNQKLCDIRTQSAISAIGNVDIEFHLSNDSSGLSEDDVKELRQAYAHDLLEDKKFVFGKYVLSADGMVWTLFFSGNVVIAVCCARSVNWNHIKASLFCEHLHPPSSTSRMWRVTKRMLRCHYLSIRRHF